LSAVVVAVVHRSVVAVAVANSSTEQVSPEVISQ
jgi:hypothetical protein